MLTTTGLLLAVLIAAVNSVAAQVTPSSRRWKQHDMGRPHPLTVRSGTRLMATRPPSDATVLFDGLNLDSWEAADSGPATWRVRSGYVEVKPGAGSIRTKEKFGDVQLHLEWATPKGPSGTGQKRGNSGIFLMGRYEVQILDSYDNETYADGQAGALYGQYPPLLNASLPPGEWQSYDIAFRRPRFDSAGHLLERARITVVHNGVLIQNNEALLGPTEWLVTPPDSSVGGEGPLELQDHGTPVRFRNIWLRKLPSRADPPADYLARNERPDLSTSALKRLAGRYRSTDGSTPAVVAVGKRGLQLRLSDVTLELVPLTPVKFEATKTDATVEFSGDRRGHPAELTFRVGGEGLAFARVK
jgi:hypothetical protein